MASRSASHAETRFQGRILNDRGPSPSQRCDHKGVAADASIPQRDSRFFWEQLFYILGLGFGLLAATSTPGLLFGMRCDHTERRSHLEARVAKLGERRFVLSKLYRAPLLKPT